jgi:hypothetical protein
LGKKTNLDNAGADNVEKAKRDPTFPPGTTKILTNLPTATRMAEYDARRE